MAEMTPTGNDIDPAVRQFAQEKKHEPKMQVLRQETAREILQARAEKNNTLSNKRLYDIEETQRSISSIGRDIGDIQSALGYQKTRLAHRILETIGLASTGVRRQEGRLHAKNERLADETNRLKQLQESAPQQATLRDAGGHIKLEEFYQEVQRQKSIAEREETERQKMELQKKAEEKIQADDTPLKRNTRQDGWIPDHLLHPENRDYRSLESMSPQERADYLNGILYGSEMQEFMFSQNEKLGSSKNIFTHTGSTDSLYAILRSGAITSRREVIANGGEVHFAHSGSNDGSHVVQNAKGIKYFSDTGEEEISVTWEQYRQMGEPGYRKFLEEKRVGSSDMKSPDQEFDQVLFAENRIYNDRNGWALCFPQRQICAEYQFSSDNDGIHVFDKKYKHEEVLAHANNSDQFFGSNLHGARVSLDQDKPFILAIDQNRSQEIMVGVRQNLLLHFNGDLVATQKWIDQHVFYYAPNRGLPIQEVSPIQEELFTRFTVPEYKGRLEFTGQLGDSATSERRESRFRMPLFRYEIPPNLI